MGKIFAISDLHLGFYRQKSMGKFGANWENHHEKIKENWFNAVGNDDYVLICGDISWATKLCEAMPDLDFIHHLPGKKILVKGNHDYWWDKTAKLNLLYDDMTFLGSDYAMAGGYALCGTRGWVCPGDSHYGDDDRKIYLRELGRLKVSLENAARSGADIIVLMHFPAFNDKDEPSGFVDIIKEYQAHKVIYGHLHGIETPGFGNRNEDAGYILTSADFLDFKPRLICNE